MELWQDTGQRERLAVLDGSGDGWRFGGHLLRGYTEAGPLLAYDLDRLHDGSVHRLCGLLGNRSLDVREALTSASLDIPPDADMTPPCPNPR